MRCGCKVFSGRRTRSICAGGAAGSSQVGFPIILKIVSAAYPRPSYVAFGFVSESRSRERPSIRRKAVCSADAERESEWPNGEVECTQMAVHRDQSLAAPERP